MMTSIRKAEFQDIDAVEQIYNDIHDSEESGAQTIGWIRGVYPVRETAEAALERGDLFVQENQGQIVGAGIINQTQVDVYALGVWDHRLPALSHFQILFCGSNGYPPCINLPLQESPDPDSWSESESFLSRHLLPAPHG